MSTHLKLYTRGTPNGHKITILLELLGLLYESQILDFATSEQKEEWFVKLNPNGRIPTLVDSSTNTTISETAAILQYLADTYDKENKFSYKIGTDLYYKQLELLYFQMAGIGPMLGQFGHFKLFAPEKIPYAIERYENEAKRLLSVLEEYLVRNKENGPYLVGDHLSIADIASFPWIAVLYRGDIGLDAWPLVKKWYDDIASLDAVKKALATAIKLYTQATPNGLKISILLELLGLKYDVRALDFSKNEQKEDWYLKLNPNGRIPTVVDSSTNTTIAETAAIMQYLVDTYDKENKFSYKIGTPLYYKQLEVLYFQMAGVGPMQGQLGHFLKAAPEKIPYAIERYENEVKRLYSVVEEYLQRNKANGPFLVGNHLSIADISVFTWANFLERGGIDIKTWPLTEKWLEGIAKLPAVQVGLGVPKRN